MEKKMIYPIFFQNSKNKERVIAEVKNMTEAFAAIKDFLNKHEYKSYYTRFWLEPYNGEDELEDTYRMVFDVGSWSEFFHIYFDSEYQANQFRNTAEFEKPF